MTLTWIKPRSSVPHRWPRVLPPTCVPCATISASWSTSPTSPTTYETTKFVIRTLRPYINHFHIGNAVVKPGAEAYGDQHPRFGFPESANDTMELVDFFHVLKAEGFFNADEPYVLSFEVKPWADEDADIVLAGTKRVINRAWALCE